MEKKVRFSAAQHSVNNSVLTINNLKKPPNQGANHLYKFCWSEKTENGRDFYPTRERRYVAKGHYTHKPTAMGNLSSLSQAMTKMQHAYDLQSQKDQAVAVCSGEKNSARTELVRQMKRSFMREFSDFKSQQSKKAENRAGCYRTTIETETNQPTKNDIIGRSLNYVNDPKRQGTS